MKGYRVWKVLKIMAMVLVAATVFGFAVQSLWNWLMPAMFGLHTITFWQALGMLLLSKILFGGFHKHGGPGRGRWGREMRARWESMSPEERERLMAGMKARRGGWCRPEPAGPAA
jgi:hypothetical protein